MNLEDFKKVRSAAKGQITRLKNWIEDNLDQETDSKQFIIRRDALYDNFLKYCQAQDEIEYSQSPGDTEDRADLENKVYSLLSKVDSYIEQLTSVKTNSNVSRNVLPNNNVPFVRLPDIHLTPFDGQISNWKSFFELFTALIIDNSCLTDIQRFFYLKSALKGEALKLVDSLDITNDNFQIAVDILKKRFENQICVVNSYFNKLLEISPITKCTSAALRDFVATLKKNYEALKKLDIEYQDLFEYLLVYMFEKKIDFGTRKAFEQDRDIDALPNLDEFFTFLEKRCVVLENISSADSRHESRYQRKPDKVSFHLQNNSRSCGESSNNNNNNRNIFCSFCETSGHKIYTCYKFSNLSHSEKDKFIKSKRLCLNCLGTKHVYQNCKSTQRCSICNQKHHSTMHVNKRNNFANNSQNNNIESRSTSPNLRRSQQTSSQNPINSSLKSGDRQDERQLRDANEAEAHLSETSPTPYSICAPKLVGMSVKNNQILLATAQVTLFSREGIPVNARILLDNGSQVSFITEKLVNKIQGRPFRRNLDISGISENNIFSNSMIDVVISSRLNMNKRYPVTCAVLEKITCKLPQSPIDLDDLNIPDEMLINFADPDFFVPSEIDMLVGADIFYSIICSGSLKLGQGLPTLLNTHLGWIIAGNLPVRNSVPKSATFNNSLCVLNSQKVCLFAQSSNAESVLDSTLRKFWEIEESNYELKENSSLSPEDVLAETIFTTTTKRLENGQYQVNMPFKTPKEYLKLGDSLKIAERRFISLENRFKKDPSLLASYKAFIDEYIRLDHAKIVPLSLKNEIGENKYFIPHLCVIRESSLTTKLRVVFDASCRTSSGKSLNDVTLKGYQVQPELYDTLLRFRGDRYVLTCDIEKMYRRVKMNPEHTFLQNILWRDTPESDFVSIELSTVTYGTNYAPFVATRVVKDAALSHQEKYPLGARILLNRIYMDDILGGVDRIEDLKQLYSEINSILNNVGFTLHKWCSNSRIFLDDISHQQALEYDLNLDNTSNKILGLKWHPQKDVLTISQPPFSVEAFPTKRIILSTIAQCFDPLGLVNPVIVKGKILMQQLWIRKLDWDTVIEDEIILKSWSEFLNYITLVSSLKIPRYLLLERKIQKVEIHGFADASMAAYGACIYIRSFYDDDSVYCALASSKSKVAPIKTISLPRLELCAMLLLAKLCNRFVKIFESKFCFESVNLWTDSQIALFWCNDHASRWSIFVSNRVSQIQDLTSKCTWRHIKSAYNPADILSRGKFTQDLIHSGFWFNGPEFLSDTKSNLNDYSSPLKIVEPVEERKITCLVTNIPNECTFWVEVFSRFSDFSRLHRTMAFVLRYINNLKKSSNKLCGTISVDELDTALTFIIKTLQNVHLSREMSELKNGKIISNKNVASLTPFLDLNGLIRVGGRLTNADVPYEQKHPLLLPSHNRIVELMLNCEHKRLGHAGAQTVLSSFRQKFWPVNGLRQTKKAIRNCIRCFRFRALPAQQVMGTLPKDRVQASRPFQKVGIDFGGPFAIKESRLRKAKVMKGYLVLFVCMVTKAVHLELVTSLSTEAFLMTLKRFLSRRGNPTIIYSDNATNFVGARNHLRDLYIFFQNPLTTNTIKDFLSLNETQWKFIPPRSPHWGGIWEAGIKNAKHHLNRLVGNAQLTFEELSTVLCQIEAILNSRPLYPLSSDPLDFECLTPGHFLIGTSLTAYPDKNLTEVKENRLSFWQRCSQMQQAFWKKWSVDYLNRLQNRPKWLYTSKNLKENDLVLLREDNVPPLYWPRARIIEALPGADGRVRAVKLRTPDGIFTRAISKVSPLPSNE